MNSASLSKLMFAGVAAGIALSCGIVVATSLSSTNSLTVSDTKTDRLNIVSAADPKSDRSYTPSIGEQVTRDEKADALEITLAILRGGDFETTHPLPFAVPEDQPAEQPEDVASVPETAVPAERPDSVASVPEETVKREQPEAVASVPDDAIPAPTSVPRAATPAVRRPVRVVTRPTGPINIIPTPAPAQNTPVAAPTTSTNFTTEPQSRATDTGIRPDLLR